MFRKEKEVFVFIMSLSTPLPRPPLRFLPFGMFLSIDVFPQLRGASGEGSLLYFPASPENGGKVQIAASVHEQNAVISAVLYMVPGPTKLDEQAFRGAITK